MRAAASRAVRSTWLALLLSLIGSVLAARVEAQQSEDTRRTKPPYGRTQALLPVRLDGHLALTWEGGFGLGARADIPIVKSFRYAPRDELALSIGADVAFAWFDGARKVEGYPSLALQWSLSVSDRFAFVPELGLGARINNEGSRGIDELIPVLAFGARCYLRRSIGLSARLGWPVAISVGAVF